MVSCLPVLPSSIAMSCTGNTQQMHTHCQLWGCRPGRVHTTDVTTHRLSRPPSVGRAAHADHMPHIATLHPW